MKNLISFLFFLVITQGSYGQACGIYRIKYVGVIQSDKVKIINIHLPTARHLEGFETDNVKSHYPCFISTNGNFNLEIKSSLTTPFNDKNKLLSYYKTKARSLKIKVFFTENDILKDKEIDVYWNDIIINIIKDNQFGTLFELNLGKIKI